MNILSLFANIGIGETFVPNVKVANELLPKRCALYQYHHPNTTVICGDITEKAVYNKIIAKAKEFNCKFILASPPCQGHSQAGKQNKDDPRNNLVVSVIDSINDLNPDYVLIENVANALKANVYFNNKKINLVECIKQNINKDYKIDPYVLNAADYGTPQTRKRAIILIYKTKWELPPKEKQITVEEAIGHLPSLESGQVSDIPYHYASIHDERHILWMKNTPTGKTAFENKIYFPQKDGRRIKGYATTYKRIYWDKPAPTITMCSGSISSQNNVHPGRLLPDGTYSDARALSIKELMILTGLPDDFKFPEGTSPNLIRQVIGEAIPPLLFKKIFDMI